MTKTKVVQEGYDKIAHEYERTRSLDSNKKFLKLLNSRLAPQSTILDIGCGSGKPVDEYFIEKGHKVIGFDISEEQIKRARQHFPSETFIARNMEDLKLGEYSVDAVLSLYAIIHVDRKLHERILKAIYSFLPIGGYFLAILGNKAWEGEDANFHGTRMYWSHFGADDYRKMLLGIGFNILAEDSVPDPDSSAHWAVLARKV